MAEIKSTLDLIMEKTRGLTMTEEEKRELREKDLVGKVRGLVQKYLDGALDMDRFREKAAALAGEAVTEFSRILTKEVLSRIEPESDKARSAPTKRFKLTSPRRTQGVSNSNVSESPVLLLRAPPRFSWGD